MQMFNHGIGRGMTSIPNHEPVTRRKSSLPVIGKVARVEHNAQRAAEIVGVLARYGLADWFKNWRLAWIQERIKSHDGRPIPDLRLAERIRLAFIELGPTFIKLRQMLGTRPDLVGLETAAELARLQGATAADPPAIIRATRHSCRHWSHCCCARSSNWKAPREKYVHTSAWPRSLSHTTPSWFGSDSLLVACRNPSLPLHCASGWIIHLSAGLVI